MAESEKREASADDVEARDDDAQNDDARDDAEADGARDEGAGSDSAGDGSDSGAEDADESAGSDGDSGGDESENISNVTAPSVGPNTTFDRRPPEERLAGHEQSSVDAMGQDKRRQVVNQGYGPSASKQILLYGAFLVVVAALLIGGKLLVDKLDQPPKTIAAKAPWAQPHVKQVATKPLQ